MSRKKKYGRKKERLGFGGVLTLFFVFLFAALLLCSYVSVFINPTVFWVPMFLGLYFIPIALVNLFILIVLLVKKKALLLVPFTALLPSLVYSDRFVKFGSSETQVTGESTTVLSYNLGRFSAAGRYVTRAEASAMVENFISEKNPDIVCLQEYLCSDRENVMSFLPQYPYRSYHLFNDKGNYGNVTLSRYPILSSEDILFEKTANLCLVSDIDLDGRIIRVFNCHLESYGMTFTSIIKRLSKKDRFADEFLHLHEKLRDATVKRAEQVSAVLKSDMSSFYPSIICGDFNDTPVSYAYHQLKKSKKDSFVESGTGFSSTYSALWPLLRIDYVLFPEEFECAGHKVERVNFSDHYPIMTEIYYQMDKTVL